MVKIREVEGSTITETNSTVNTETNSTVNTEANLPVKRKIAALDNYSRFYVMNMLEEQMKNYPKSKYDLVKYSLTTDEIKKELKEEYKKSVTTQMVGEYLKTLKDAGLVERKKVDKDKEGLPLSPSKFGYYIKEDSSSDLIFDINFLNDEVLTLMDIYHESRKAKTDNNCVITVCNGKNKGKRLTINENQVAVIGRKTLYEMEDSNSIPLCLSRSYESVSRINKPHLKIYNKKGTWYMLDQSSTNGTFKTKNNKERVKKEELPKNSFIKLSNGPGRAIIHCLHN